MVSGLQPVEPFFVCLWINLWTNLWITNVVISTLTRHNGVMKENQMYPIPCTECEYEMTEARNFDEVGRPLCPECA